MEGGAGAMVGRESRPRHVEADETARAPLTKTDRGREVNAMAPQTPLDETKAAKRLGVTKGTLANWRSRKYGPPYLKVGRRVEYFEADLDAWRAAQRRDPAELAAS